MYRSTHASFTKSSLKYYRAIPLEGKQIQDVTEDLHREIIDVEVEAEFKRRVYEETQSLDTKRFRVVGILDEDADDYHFYITNLLREEILSVI